MPFALATGGIVHVVPDATAVRIGRDPRCEIRLDSASVSRVHARAWTASGALYVEDLRSRNGVLVGGRPISAPTRLETGHRVVIGDRTLVVASVDEARPTVVMRGELDESGVARPTTGTQSIHQVLLDAARSALGEGRWADAADALGHFFDAATAPGLPPMDPRLADDASAPVLRLADGVEDAVWLERWLGLRRWLELPLDAPTLEELARRYSTLPEVDAAHRRAFCNWMRSRPLRFTERAALQRLAGARGR